MKANRCFCWVCRGSEQLPALGTRPPVFQHEIAPRPEEPPVDALPRPSVAPREPRAIQIAPPPLSLEEKIARINARTDIGAALKKMQISNLLRKSKQNG